jgi:hypothetical protein
MQIEEGKFYRSHDGQVLRCLRVTPKITSFSHLETAALEGPTESITTFISEAKLEEITETEYVRTVIAWHNAQGNEEKFREELEAIKDIAKPIIHAKFQENGGYKDFDLKTEEMTEKELAEATRKTEDDAAPIAIVFKAQTLIEPLTTIRSMIEGLQAFQEKHWCVEVRNAIIDLENAHGWLTERQARKKAQAADADQTAVATDAIDEGAEFTDNVLPLNQ